MNIFTILGENSYSAKIEQEIECLRENVVRRALICRNGVSSATFAPIRVHGKVERKIFETRILKGVLHHQWKRSRSLSESQGINWRYADIETD